MRVLKCLLLFIAMLLTGCGIKTGGIVKDLGESSQQKGNSVEQVNVTMVHCWTQQDAINQIADSYNSLHDDIQLNVEYIPIEQYISTLKNRSAAGKLPDIYMGWPGSSMDWFYQNNLALDLSEEDWVKRLDEKTRNDSAYQGKVRILPLNKTFICIGYNKKLFENVGCSIPKNYKDFLCICEKLKQNGIQPIALGSRDGSGYIYSSWMLAISEIYAHDPDYNLKLYAGEEKMSERWRTILERQYEWIEKGYVDKNHLTLDRMSDSLDMFLEEKAGMFVLGSWELDNIVERMKEFPEPISMGFFPMPATQDKGSLLFASGEGVCVNALSSRAEAALNVLDYFTQKEPNETFQMAMKSFSTFQDLELEYEFIPKEISDYVNMGNTWGYPDAFWPRNIGDEYSKLFPEYLTGLITEEEFLGQMDNLWSEAIESL